MIGALGKSGMGTAQTPNLLSGGGGVGMNQIYSNFMVEVDEFKFSKIMTNVIHKSHFAIHEDEMSGLSNEDTELSGDEEGEREDDETKSEIERNEAKQF